MGVLRDGRTFYGIYTDNWTTTWGGMANHHYHLVETYMDTACSVTTYTNWNSNGVEFLFPHNIEKHYVLEGVVEGEITFMARTAKSNVSDFRVTVFKESSAAATTDLATTGVISVNEELTTGSDIKYHYWIDVFASGKELDENERIGVRVEWDVSNNSTTTASLLHDNDSSLEDLWIKVPLLL